MDKTEKIHGPIASLSNLHEMFLVSFKKRFSENAKSERTVHSYFPCMQILSHSNATTDFQGKNGKGIESKQKKKY